MKSHVLLPLAAILAISFFAAGNELQNALSPEDSAKRLNVVGDLECRLWAHEPDVINPTAMDIDEKGRVWITEGANYRNKYTVRPEGDRIVILEDTTGAGICNKATCF